MLLKISNKFEFLFSNYLSFIFFILTAISIYFNFYSWLFFIFLLISILIKISQKIFEENKNIFNFIIFMFFVKFLIFDYLYIFFEFIGLPLGTIGGSDDISYFVKGKIIAEFIKNNLISELNKRLFVYHNEYFYHYNVIVNYIDTKIALKDIVKINIFINSISTVLIYFICKNINLNTYSTFTVIFLYLIDLKINFFSFFNLKETYIIFSSLSCLYLCSLIISSKFNSYLIFITSIIGLLVGLLFRYQYFTLSIFVILVTFLIKLILIKKNLFLNKIFLLLSFLFLILLTSLLFNPVDLIIDYNNLRYSNYQKEIDYDSSIANYFVNLKYSDNIFFFFVHFASGILGIFPIFKDLNLHMTFQLYAQVWTHLLMISGFLFFLKYLKSLKKIDKHKNFFIFIVLFYSLIILSLSTIASLGSMEFFRYSLFFNVLLILLIGCLYQLTNIFNVIKKTLLIYIFINLILLIPYYSLKNTLI